MARRKAQSAAKVKEAKVEGTSNVEGTAQRNGGDYTKKTVHNTVIVFVFLIFSALCAYLFRMILARKLTLAEYGLFFSLVAFAGILNIFRDLGLSYAVAYFIPRYLAKRRYDQIKGFLSKILRIEVISTLIVCSLFIILSDFLVVNYFHSGTVLILTLFAVSFFLNAMELNFQLFFNAFQNQFLYSVHNLARNLFVLIFIIVLFMLFDGILVPIIAYIITYVLLLLVFGTVFFRKVFPKYFSTKSAPIDTRGMYIFGFSASISFLGVLILNSTDTLVLTYFRTLEEVGLYNGVVPIVAIILYVPYAISSVIIPMGSELFAKKRMDTLKILAEKTTRLTLVVLIPLIGLAISYPSMILSFFFGSVFASAATALVILSAGVLFYAIAQINMSLLFALSGPKKNIIIYVTGAVVNVVLNFLLIPKYGIIGAAIATAVSYVVIFAMSTYHINKLLGLKTAFAKYILCIASGAIFVLVLHYLKGYITLPVVPQMIVLVVVAGLVYLSLIFLLRIITIDEIIEIKDKVMK